jgi:hypothetical protein
VDHLANAIETQWQENQSLVLTKPKQGVQEVGVLVLWMWLKNKTVLSKKIQLIVWQHFKDFLSS